MATYLHLREWGGWQDENPAEYSGRLYCKRLRVTRDGYVRIGKDRRDQPIYKYFGSGEPLYRITSEEGHVDFEMRAASRQVALDMLRTYYPKAKVRGQQRKGK